VEGNGDTHGRCRAAVLFATHLVAAAVLAERSRLVPWPLVAGAALPDLVDKPLASLGVVDLFHTVGHSALLVVVLVPVAAVSRRGLAFAVGWALHLALDALHVVVNGRPTDALFLGWPLVVPPDPLAIPPGEFVLFYLWSPAFFLEGLVWAAFVAVLLDAGGLPAWLRPGGSES
jgi:hypothetical protein